MSDDNNPQGTVEEGGFANLAEAASAFGRIVEAEENPASEEAEPEEQEEEAQAEAESEPEEQTDEEPASDEEPEAEEDGQSEVENSEEVRQGQMRQADYTRKTQELASEKRAFEEERAQATQHLNQTAQHLNSLIQEVQSLNADNQEPDWVKLAQEDPIGFAETKARWDHKQSVLRKAQEQTRALQQEQARQQEEALQRHRAEQAEIVLQNPLFADVAKDPAKIEARQQQLGEFANRMGFDAEDFNNVADARIYNILEMARRYEVTQKATKDVASKAKPAPRNRKPGSAPLEATRPQEVGKSMSKLARTGRVEDAARLFSQLE